MEPTGSDVTAASSPAPVSSESVLSSLNHAERESWQKTGALPDRINVTPKAESSPAKTPAASSPAEPVEQAASTDATAEAASEPAAPKTSGKKDAESRIKELLRANEELRRDLARLHQPAPAAPPRAPESAAPTPPTRAEHQRLMALPNAPKEADFDSYAEYTAAASLFITEQMLEARDARAREQRQLSERTERVRKTIDDAAQRIEAYRAIEPDLESKINPALLEVDPASLVPKGQPIGPENALMEHVLRSDVTPQLLMHFSTPEGVQEWRRLCAAGPDMLRALGRLEASCEAKAAAPVTKHVSSAPAPAKTVGDRPADHSDPVEAAVKSGDPTRYIREANKRALAALRG